MSRIYWKRARTLSELDEAQKLRFHCISTELGILAANYSGVERDISSTDCLSTTEHVLVYDDERCVGTARIAFPRRELAGVGGARLELEDAGIDVAGLHEIRARTAEISRLCVLERWHGTSAVIRLYEGLYVLSRQCGVRFWVGGVDCKTSILKEAELMRAVLARRGAMSTRFQLTASSEGEAQSGHPSARATSSFYTPKQLEYAEHGQSDSFPIAGALVAFTKRLGASCIGRPVLHPTFPRCVMPMLVDLDALPDATLRLFDRAQLTPFQPATSPAASPLLDAKRVAS